MTKASVDNFANYEQLVGGVETLFKGSADVVKDYADGAFKTAGMSANDYMDTVTSFSATLLQSLGGDTAAAADMAHLAITDMADNANKMGTDISMIQNAYQGFAKQNYTMLDNLKLGYGGTAREMARLVNESGLLSEAQKINLDDTQKLGEALQNVGFDTIIQAIHEIQVQMDITGTTAAEAADTISGSVSSMKAAWDNWLVGLANPEADLTGLTQTLVDSFGTVVDNVLPVVGRIGESLVQVFADTTGIDISPAIAKIQEFSTAATGIVSDLISSFRDGGFSGLFDGLLAGFEELTGIDLGPFTTKFQILASVMDGFSAGGFSGAFEEIITQVENLTGLDLSGIKTAFSGIGDALDDVASAFLDGGFSGAVDEIINKFEELTGIDVSGVFGSIGDAVENLIATFNEGGVSGLFDGLLTGFEELTGIDLGPFIDSIGNAFSGLGEYLGVIWDGIKPFLAFMVTEIPGAVSALIEHIRLSFDTIVGAMTDLFNFIGDMYRGVADIFRGDFDAALEHFKSAFSDLGSFFSGVVDGIKSIFENLISWFAGFGARLADGLKSGFSGAVDMVKDIAGDISDGFKNFFGIKSPSRVFALYGKYMAEGLGVGWESKIGTVLRDMEQSVDMGALYEKIDFSSSAVGKSSSGMIGSLMSALPDTGGMYNINLVVDGRTMASAVFDPLNSIAKQKGVSAAW